MKAFALIFSLVALCSLVGANSSAKTLMIHAVGIDPVVPKQNHEDFYVQAKAFLAACKNMGLKTGSECKLLLDTDPNKRAEPNSALTIPKELSQGAATPKVVLQEIETLLLQAKPGDQVVISLSNHGTSIPFSGSCIAFGDDYLCKGDIEEKLKKFRKPGVKVFVSTDACFSGGFSELSNKDTCTLVASDRLFEGYGSLGFWETLVNLKANGSRVSLADIAHSLYWHEYMQGQGGGFASQVIRRRACSTGKVLKSTPDHLERLTNSFKKIHKQTVFNGLQTFLQECESSTIPDQEFKQFREIADIVGIIDGSWSVAQNYINESCSPESDTTKTACSAIRDLQQQLVYFHSHVSPKLSAIYLDYSRKALALIRADNKLFSKSKTIPGESESQIDAEAERGELLEEYLTAKAELLSRARHFLSSGDLERWRLAAGKVMEEFCFSPFEKVDIEKKDYDFSLKFGRFIAAFSLDGMGLSRVPSTENALREAKQCEESFVF